MGIELSFYKQQSCKSAKRYCRAFQWLLYINKQRTRKTYHQQRGIFMITLKTQLQNCSSWHQQLQKKHLTWYKPSVRTKALDLTAYPRQSWRKLRMKPLLLSRQSLTIPLKMGSFPTYWNLHKWFQYLKMDLDYPATTTHQSVLSNIGKIIEKLILCSSLWFLLEHLY